MSQNSKITLVPEKPKPNKKKPQRKSSADDTKLSLPGRPQQPKIKVSTRKESPKSVQLTKSVLKGLLNAHVKQGNSKQRTQLRKASSPSLANLIRDKDDLLVAVTLPYLEGKFSPTVRIADKWNIASTITAAPFEPLDIISDLYGNIQIYSFRSVLRSYVYGYYLVDTVTYQLEHNYQGGISLTTVYFAVGGDSEPLPVIFTRAFWVSGLKLHGPNLYPGRSEDHPAMTFIWMDLGTVLQITVTSITTGSSWALVPFISTQEGDFIQSVVDISAITGYSFTPSAAGYYGFEVICYDQTAETDYSLIIEDWLLVTAADSACFGHRAIVDFATFEPMIKALRMIGNSVEFSNTTPVLQRGGNIAIKQMAPNSNWYEAAAASSPYDYISGQKDPKIGDLSLGGYAWFKPALDSDLEMSKEFFYDESLQCLARVGFKLWEHSGYVAIVGASPSTATSDSDTPVIQYQSGVFKLGYNFEYTSDNTWLAQGVARMTIAQQDAVFSKLKDAPQYSENPLHVSDMLSWIKNAIGWGVKNAPAIINTVKGVADVAKTIGGML